MPDGAPGSGRHWRVRTSVCMHLIGLFTARPTMAQRKWGMLQASEATGGPLPSAPQGYFSSATVWVIHFNPQQPTSLSLTVLQTSHRNVEPVNHTCTVGPLEWSGADLEVTVLETKKLMPRASRQLPKLHNSIMEHQRVMKPRVLSSCLSPLFLGYTTSSHNLLKCVSMLSTHVDTPRHTGAALLVCGSPLDIAKVEDRD